MTISLKRFLTDGSLGTIRVGIPVQDIWTLLGPPDDVGGTSRNHPHPSIYLYGSVELCFSRSQPYACSTIFWQAQSRGAFRLTSDSTIEDWEIAPNTEREQVEIYLRRNGYTFDLRLTPTMMLVLASGVSLIFDERERLEKVGVCLSDMDNGR